MRAPARDGLAKGRLVAWLAGLVAAIAVLHLAGRGVLAPPAPAPGAIRRWLVERDAITVAFLRNNQGRSSAMK